MKKLFFVVSMFLILLLAGCSVSDKISVTKQIPIQVNSGDTFTFSVTIQNSDTKKHDLKSIDIDTAFLDGIAILKTDPDAREEYTAFGMHTFEFDIQIHEQVNTVVTFTAKAIRSGDFGGDLDICVDSDISCLLNQIRVIVN